MGVTLNPFTGELDITGGSGGGGGSVNSVSGTTNRITVTGTTDPVVDIAATYVGQASITTLGTIATGTWSATTIAVNKGGTGQTTYTDGQLLIGNSSGNTLTKATLTGTSNRLSVTNGNGSITLDIDAAYVGQASITTLGTITTGVWTGTTIAVANGGTGQTSYTNGQLLIGNTTGNTLTKATLTGTANQVVVTNSTGSITLSTPQDIATGSSPTFSALTITNSIKAGTFGRFGSTSDPTNTTAGDLTAIRLSLGNSAAFSGGTGYFAQFTGTMTDTSGTAAYMFVNATAAPASASTSTFQGINFLLTVNATSTVTGVVGGNFANVVLSSGAITTIQGFLGNAVQTTSSSAATVSGTTAQAVVALPLARVSGTTTGTYTTVTGFDMNLGIVGNSAWTITSLFGYRISNLLATGNTITTFAGARIEKLAAGTTNNYGIQIDQPGLNNAIGTTTDSIAIKLTTATVAMSNQTATTTNAIGFSLGIQTYTSTTLTRTITNAHTLYIEGAPVASTNVTFTNTAYSLFVDSGQSRFDAALDLSNISAGTTNLIITATSDTPTVTWGLAAGNESSTTPAGYIEITVGGNARYIPFWA